MNTITKLANREKARQMAQAGLPLEQISALVDYKMPESEWNAAKADTDFAVRRVLRDLATSGKCPAATMFWLKPAPQPKECFQGGDASDPFNRGELIVTSNSGEPPFLR